MPVDTVIERRPDLFDQTIDRTVGDYIVIVFNNEVNTYDQVIAILQKATGCSLGEEEEGDGLTWSSVFPHSSPNTPCPLRVSVVSLYAVGRRGSRSQAHASD